MRATRGLVLGLALVWLDLSVQGLDVLPDPVGWVVAALALRRMADRHPVLWVATGGAALAAAVSVVTWVPVWGLPPGPPTPLRVVEGLLGVAVVVTVCSALVVLLDGPDRPGAAQAAVIRWLDPVLALAALLVTGAVALQAGVVTDVGPGPFGLLAVLLVVGGIAVRVWFLVLVVRHGEPLDDPLADDQGDGRPDADDFGVVERPGQSSGW